MHICKESIQPYYKNHIKIKKKHIFCENYNLKTMFK